MANHSSSLNSSNTTQEAMEAMQVIEEIANLLGTGLDKETLSICVNLIENGINPSTLAHSILDIQRDASKMAANAASYSK